MLRMLFAAPASGSGKTAVTCGMLSLLKRRGYRPAAFKCGPDYIDPMFHRSVLQVESHNMDLYLSDEHQIRCMEVRYGSEAGHGAEVFEGVMGYYDGVGGVTTRASAWHVADTLHLPVILVLRARGASLTLAAQIQGMQNLRKPDHICGVILNECSPMLFHSLKPALEKETGIPMLGCLPHMEEAAFESRHLGLYTAGEIQNLEERIGKIADELEKNLDFERLIRVCGAEEKKQESRIEDGKEKTFHIAEGSRQEPDDIGKGRREETVCSGKTYENAPVIAVAKDEAFCFLYEESLDAFRDAGAEVVFFSPLKDRKLPAGCSGLYLTGGYPELYTRQLSENRLMIQSVRRAVAEGMPTVAECGGFLYLGKSLEGKDGVSYPMTGVLPGQAVYQNHLVRFGYAMLTAKEDSLLFRAGDRVPVHEFHYWDSTENGTAFNAVKPVSGRSWECGIVSDTLYAGFPHLYFAGHPELAERLVKACAEYQGKH